jgi:hypothetical protein
LEGKEEGAGKRLRKGCRNSIHSHFMEREQEWEGNRDGRRGDGEEEGGRKRRRKGR